MVSWMVVMRVLVSIISYISPGCRPEFRPARIGVILSGYALCVLYRTGGQTEEGPA
jgi:hypothetical protein